MFTQTSAPDLILIKAQHWCLPISGRKTHADHSEMEDTAEEGDFAQWSRKKENPFQGWRVKREKERERKERGEQYIHTYVEIYFLYFCLKWLATHNMHVYLLRMFFISSFNERDVKV